MQVRNFAESTIDSYTWHVDKCCQYYGKRPKKLPMVLSDENELLNALPLRYNDQNTSRRRVESAYGINPRFKPNKKRTPRVRAATATHFDVPLRRLRSTHNLTGSRGSCHSLPPSQYPCHRLDCNRLLG
jgi:hypothetical protein